MALFLVFQSIGLILKVDRNPLGGPQELGVLLNSGFGLDLLSIDDLIADPFKTLVILVHVVNESFVEIFFVFFAVPSAFHV